MSRIIAFFLGNRSLVLFIFLELISVWLLISYNQRYNSSFLNSSSLFASSMNSKSKEVSGYFELDVINKELLKENEHLRNKISLKRDLNYLDTLDELYIVRSAKVVDNSFRRAKNFFTITKGYSDSIQTGMGVISSLGIAGQVKSVSKNFSTVYSLLHPNLIVSSKIKRTGTICTTQWDQRTYDKAKLKYIPRHIKLREGDTITTSGYNSVFPEDIMIGIVESFNLSKEMTFYEASIKLSTDFTSLDYVYVIQDLCKVEKDSIMLL